jgi:hypothetical protein
MYTTLRNHPIFSDYAGYKPRDYRNVITLIDQLAEVGCSVRSGNPVFTSDQVQAFVFEAFIQGEHFVPRLTSWNNPLTLWTGISPGVTGLRRFNHPA